MLLVFLRHSSVAALVGAVVVEALAFLSGWLSIRPILILLGALLFYLSEYGMHRFAFHAPPLSWPLARRLQHRLHYDHHVEPGQHSGRHCDVLRAHATRVVGLVKAS